MDVMELMSRRAAEAMPREPQDYLQDGLLYCGRCGTPKECRMELDGRERVLRCMCACTARRREAEERREAQEAEARRVERLRMGSVVDAGLRRCRFEDAEDSSLIADCRRYVENWERAASENLGLLLWGDTGGGKTFAAACIVNALIDRGIPAVLTSFPLLLAADWEERETFLRNAGRFPLLVLDDLGVEQRGSKASDYALRTVYSVVNKRYNSGRPLIVTTNLTLDALRDPEDLAYRRVYERVLELCAPLKAPPRGYRKEKAARKLRCAMELLGKRPGRTP